MDSAEPLSSILWTLTPHPGGSAAAGHVGCRGFGAILFAEFRCKSLVPSSEFGAVGCVRAGIARVSEDFVGYWIVRFSLLVGWTVRFCGYVGFLPWLFVGFALTAVGSFVLVDNVMENQIIRSLNRTNALYNMASPSLFGEMDLHPTKLNQYSRSAVIQKTCVKSYTNSVFFPPNNEKRAIQAKQDQLKRERYRAEHKAPKHHVEVATKSPHRIPESYIPVNPRQPNQPAAAEPPGGRVRVQRIGKGGFANPAVPVLWCPRKEQ